MASSALSAAEIRLGDFYDVISTAEPGDFIYCDPPYLPVSKTSSFDAYSFSRFPDSEHDRLARTAKEAARRGVQLMISSSDTPLAREIYGGLDVVSVESARSISARRESRRRVGELVITSGYQISARREDPS